jgi:hypothetical protein
VTGKVREHGGGGGRVEGTMMEPERGLAENRKWTQTKSREYRRPLGRRAAASAECGKAAQNRGKSLLFSWSVHRYSDSICNLGTCELRRRV